MQSGQQIFLDASTTALQVARLIKDREDLVVVTNGLYTALELNFCAGITTIVVGGTMRHRSSSLVGSFNHDSLQRLRLDLGFFGARGGDGAGWADGIRPGRGPVEAADGQRIARWSSASSIPASSTIRSFSVFALPQEIDRIITDDGAPAATVAACRAQGVMSIWSDRPRYGDW